MHRDKINSDEVSVVLNVGATVEQLWRQDGKSRQAVNSRSPMEVLLREQKRKYVDVIAGDDGDGAVAAWESGREAHQSMRAKRQRRTTRSLRKHAHQIAPARPRAQNPMADRPPTRIPPRFFFFFFGARFSPRAFREGEKGEKRCSG